MTICTIIHIQCRTSLAAGVSAIQYDTRVNVENGGGVVICHVSQDGQTLLGPLLLNMEGSMVLNLESGYLQKWRCTSATV